MKATIEQLLEIGKQIVDGRIDFDLAEAIIDGEVTINPPPGYFLHHFPGDELPDMSVLEYRFSGRGSVSTLFRDGWRLGDAMPRSCANPGDRAYTLLEIPDSFVGTTIRDSRTGLNACLEDEGCRFATGAEAVTLAYYRPELQTKHPMLALGSYAVQGDGKLCYTVLTGTVKLRILGARWEKDELARGDQLLAVKLPV